MRHARLVLPAGRRHWRLAGVVVFRAFASKPSPDAVEARNMSTVGFKPTYVSSHYRMPDGEIVRYLTRKNLVHRVSDVHAIVKECPFCKPHKNSRDNLWKLYIWLENGRCFCHRCGLNCSFYDFKRQTGGLAGISTTLGGNSKAHDKQLDQAKAFESRERLETEPDVLKYLTETRGLSRDVLKKYGVGSADVWFASGGESPDWKLEKCVTFPWARMDEDSGYGPLYVDRLKIRSIEQKANQRLEPRGGPWGLFGWHTVPASAEVIVITEGEFDAMAVYQTTGVPAVSLPNGANSFPVEIIPCLERFQKIIIWMDDDTAGQDGATKFMRKVGLGRCFNVRSKQGSASGPKDANEALLNPNCDMKELLDKAERPAHLQIMSVKDLRGDILHELQNGSRFEGVPITTLPSLNKLLKGHRRGELTVFTGPTGMGKTTVLSQMSLDLCLQGVNTLWGSFEIKNHRLAKTMLNQLHGQSIANCSSEEFDEMFERFEKLPIYFLKFFGATDIHQVLEAMEFAVYVHDVDHILLDNLQFMLGTASGGSTKFDLQDQAISMLRKFATDYNVHLTLVIHPRKVADGETLSVSSIFGSARATQEADNVVILQPSQATPEIRLISVDKNRYDGEMGKVPYRFDRHSKRVVELDDFEREQLRLMMAAVRSGQQPATFVPSVLDPPPVRKRPKPPDQNPDTNDAGSSSPASGSTSGCVDDDDPNNLVPRGGDAASSFDQCRPPLGPEVTKGFNAAKKTQRDFSEASFSPILFK
ncbi:SF4 helicase domain-containing protein [Plasmodiophora brassicae]